jgi:CRP-like cAMP-binding protein
MLQLSQINHVLLEEGRRMNITEKLQDIDLFSGLEGSQFNKLAEISEICTRKKDDYLFKVGEDAHHVYVLLGGKVSIQVPLSSRPEMVSIVILSKEGQLIGWSGLMGPSHYTADAICLDDSTFLEIHGEEFFKVLESNKAGGFGVLQKIITVISERLRNIQRVVLKTM